MNNKQTLAVASTSLLAAGMAHGDILYQGGQYSSPINYQIDQHGTYSLDLDADAVPDYSIYFDNGANLDLKPLGKR